MSKLTNYQIMAMIDRLASTIRNGEPKGLSGTATRARKKLAEYQAELQSRMQAEKGASESEKNVQVARLELANCVCLQQNQFQKRADLHVFREKHMQQKKDELAVIGDQLEIDHQAAVDVSAWVGRQQAFGMIANKCSAAQAQILKRLKDTSAHKAFGLTREDFCTQHLGINRSTADRIIANLEEFGTAYFALSNIMRISSATYRLLAPAVDGNELIFGDEKIPITKANADKILEAVNAAREEAEQANKQLSNAKSDLKKANAACDNAKKATEKTRKEFAEFRDNVEHQAERAWEHADEDQRFLIKLEIDRDFLLQRLRSFADCRELSQANQDRLVAFCEATWAEVHQVCEKIRGAYGVGLLQPNPASSVEVDELTPNKRSLIGEYDEKHPLKK
jgi:hypothetical protein